MTIGNPSLVLAGVLTACVAAMAQIPPDAEIRKILADRIGAENRGAALVVGVIDANGRRVIAYGFRLNSTRLTKTARNIPCRSGSSRRWPPIHKP